MEIEIVNVFQYKQNNTQQQKCSNDKKGQKAGL